jgi:hypothetical protein
MASLTTGAAAGFAVDVCVAGFAVDGVAGGFAVDCVVGGFAVDGVVAGGFAVDVCAISTTCTDGSIRLTAVITAVTCRAVWKRVLAAI